MSDLNINGLFFWYRLGTVQEAIINNDSNAATVNLEVIKKLTCLQNAIIILKEMQC
jgi:hypothetical protein